MRAIAQAVVEIAKKDLGLRPMGIEGLTSGSWVLVDLGDIVFHVFNGAAILDFLDLNG